MKTFIKICLITLCVAGFLLLTLPVKIFPSFYDVRYMGWAAFVGAAIIFAIPHMLRVPEQSPNAQTKNHAVDLLQLLLTFIIMTNALGDLGLYQLYRVGIEFDKIIHFLIPFGSVLILPLFFEERFGIRPFYSVVVALLLSLPLEVVWEIFEYLADSFFQTHLYGVYGMDISRDTKLDLIFDCAGSTLAGLIGIFVPTWKEKIYLFNKK